MTIDENYFFSSHTQDWFISGWRSVAGNQWEGVRCPGLEGPGSVWGRQPNQSSHSGCHQAFPNSPTLTAGRFHIFWREKSADLTAFNIDW